MKPRISPMSKYGDADIYMVTAPTACGGKWTAMVAVSGPLTERARANQAADSIRRVIEKVKNWRRP